MIVFEWRAQEKSIISEEERNKRQMAGRRDGAYSAGLIWVLSVSFHFPVHGPLIKQQGKSEDTVLHMSLDLLYEK